MWSKYVLDLAFAIVCPSSVVRARVCSKRQNVIELSRLIPMEMGGEPDVGTVSERDLEWKSVLPLSGSYQEGTEEWAILLQAADD